MQIETLQIFCDLVELKSFSKAAAKNMLSQSAVSQQLAQLERTFNTTLIGRDRRSFEITGGGELFYNTCKAIINEYEKFQSNLNFLKNSARSRIRIAAIYSIGMHSLQAYIRKFMAAAPAVHLDIDYLSAKEIYSRLLAGKIDAGLVAVPRYNPDIEVFDFLKEPLVCVCNPKHPFAKKKTVDICMMQYHDFVAFEKNLATRRWIDEMLIRYNIAIKPVMEFDNVETIKRVVEINAGISIMPLTTVKNEIAAGTLTAIEFSNEKFVRPTGIIVLKNRTTGQHLKAFIEILSEGANADKSSDIRFGRDYNKAVSGL